MSRGGNLQSRLEALESQLQPVTYPEGSWPADDQLDEVLDHVQVAKWGRTTYRATDRELRILAGLHAYHELPDGAGELELPSGTVVSLKDAGDGLTDMDFSGVVIPSDLPESVRRYVERLDPEKQPDREAWLYENRHENKAWRELADRRIAWHRENGWDKPTPAHLLPGGGGAT